jgi:hypothetical protein
MVGAAFSPPSFFYFLLCILTLINVHILYIAPSGFRYGVSGLPRCLYTMVLEPKPFKRMAGKVLRVARVRWVRCGCRHDCLFGQAPWGSRF